MTKSQKIGFKGFVDTYGKKILTDNDLMLDRLEKLLKTKSDNVNETNKNFIYTGTTSPYVESQPKRKVEFNITKIS